MEGAKQAPAIDRLLSADLMDSTGKHLKIPAPIPKNSDPFNAQSVCFEVNFKYRFNRSILGEINGLRNCVVHMFLKGTLNCKMG
jgi:hypothetical protein